MAVVMVAMTGSLLGGSMIQGQAQTTGPGDLKRQMKLAPPPPDESSSNFGAFSGAGTDADLESEGILPNVQVSRNATGTLVDVITPAGVVVGKRLTDCVRVGASETTIARNGDGLVAGYNDGIGFAGAPFFRGPCTIQQDGLSGFAFSTDEGASWTVGGAPPVGHVIAFGPGRQGCSTTGRYVTRGDPWLDVDDDTFVYVNLAQWNDNGESSAFPCFAPAAGGVPTAGMSVHFGTFDDGGFTWHKAILLQSPNYPGDFLDKEALAVDPQSRGAIFITTTNFTQTCGVAANGFGQIELYRSLNGGATWDRRIVQPDETFVTNPNNPDCGTDGIVNQGSVPVVGRGGELFVVWERGWLAPEVGAPPQGLSRATIALKMSINRGATFGPLRTIKSICSQGIFPPAGYNRKLNNDFPRVAVAQNGPFEGRIFVTFQDCSATNGTAPFGHNTDVYIAFSDNFGATWTIRPVHPPADGKVHFFPVVGVGTSGEVRVVYHESQEVTPDPAHPNAIVCSVRVGGPLNNPVLRRSTKVSLVDVMEAVSNDGGQTFVTRRVTTQTTNWCKATPINSIIPNFGDYIDARSGTPRGLALWGDGRNRNRVDFVPTVFFGGGESEASR
jgi:hypothetical protein